MFLQETFLFAVGIVVSAMFCNHDNMQSHNTEANCKCYGMRSELYRTQPVICRYVLMITANKLKGMQQDCTHSPTYSSYNIEQNVQ